MTPMANLGPDFVVNSTAAGDQSSPAVAALPDGEFVVTWMSFDQVPWCATIRARLFNADGTPDGNDFIVGGADPTYPPLRQNAPAVAALPDNHFAVTWEFEDVSRDVYGFPVIDTAHFDLNGTWNGTDSFSPPSFRSTFPVVATLADGHFVLAWNEVSFPQGAYQVRLSAGSPPVLVNSTLTNGPNQPYPAIAALPDGGLVVTWQSNDSGDGSGTLVRARLFDAGGSALGNDFVVDSSGAGDQSAPAVAALSDGDFVVTWQS